MLLTGMQDTYSMSDRHLGRNRHLAAGRPIRMALAAGHKFPSTFKSVALMRHVAMRPIDSRANNVNLVTGLRHSDTHIAFEGLDVMLVRLGS